MRQHDDDSLADALEAVMSQAVKLAQMLESAESEAAAIADECNRLGVAARVMPTLAALRKVPSDAAERLQDDLDRIAGELHHPPVAAQDPTGHSPRFTATGPTH